LKKKNLLADMETARAANKILGWPATSNCCPRRLIMFGNFGLFINFVDVNGSPCSYVTAYTCDGCYCGQATSHCNMWIQYSRSGHGELYTDLYRTPWSGPSWLSDDARKSFIERIAIAECRSLDVCPRHPHARKSTAQRSRLLQFCLRSTSAHYTRLSITKSLQYLAPVCP